MLNCMSFVRRPAVSVWLTHDIELHRVGGGVSLRVESLTLVLSAGHPLNLLQDQALLGQDNPLLLVADQLFPLKWYLSLSRRLWLFWLSWRFTIKSQSVVYLISDPASPTQYLSNLAKLHSAHPSHQLGEISPRRKQNN